MSNQQIDGLVGPDVPRSLRELVLSLEEVDKTFTPLLEKIRGLSNDVTKSSKDIRDMVKAFQDYQKIMTEGSQALSEHERIQKQITAVRERSQSVDRNSLMTLQQLKEETRALSAEITKEMTQQAASSTSQQNATRRKIDAREETRRYTQEIKRQQDIEKGGEQTYRAKSALLAQLRERYKDAGNELKTQLIPQIQKLDRELKNEDATLGVHTRHVGGYTNAIKALIPGLSRFSTGFGAMGVAVLGAYKAFQMFTQAVKYGIQVNREYEQQNANLASILGVTRRQTQALQEQSIELGRTTEYTAVQVVKAQTELAKLGFGQNTIRNITEPLLGFATALGATLPNAAQVAGQALRAFNVSSGDTSEVLATMTLAANRSAMDFQFLERSIAIVGASASVAGVSLKDTLSLLGVLANSGLDASRAATALRNIFLYLVDDSKKLGKELKGTQLTAEGISKAFAELRQKGVDLADMFELTDKRAVNALAVLIQNAEQVTVLKDEMQELTGVLDRIRGTRLDTLEGDIILLKSAWDGFWLSFRESSPLIRSTVQTLTDLLNTVASIREEGLQNDLGSSAFATDLIDQIGIGASVDEFDKELKRLYAEYNELLATDLDAASDKYKEMIEYGGKVVKEQGDIAVMAAKNIQNYSARVRALATQTGNNTGRDGLNELANRFETVENSQREIDGLRELIGLWEDERKQEETTYERRIELQNRIRTGQEALRNQERDIIKQQEAVSGFIDVLYTRPNQADVKAVREVWEEYRLGYGRMLTEQRKYDALSGALNENKRISPLGSTGNGLSNPTKKEIQAEEQRQKRARQLQDEEDKASIRNQMREYELLSKLQKGIADDETADYERRKNALEAYIKVERYLLELKRDEADETVRRNARNKNIGLTGRVGDSSTIDPITGLPQTDEDAATLQQRIDVREKYEVQLQDLINKGSKERVRLEEKESRDSLKNFKSGLDERLRAVEAARQKELEKLARLNSSGNIGSAEYKEEKAFTNERFDRQAIEQTQLFYEQWLSQSNMPETLRKALMKLFEEYMAKMAANLSSSSIRSEDVSGSIVTSGRRSTLSRLRNFFGGGVTRNEEGDVDEEGSKNSFAEAGKGALGFLNSKEVQLTISLYNDMSKVIEGFYDLEIQKIEEAIAARNEWYDNEQQKLTDRLTLLDQNHQAELISDANFNAQSRQIQLQQMELEKQQEAENKKSEAEKRKLQVEQAKWNKANSIVQASMNTAVAVANALTVQPFPLGLALSVVAASVGAAQIALISSQQIPKYAKGTDDHMGGLMITGDAGVHEIGLTPSGSVFRTPDTPTLMEAPKHTKIFPSEDAYIQYIHAMNSVTNSVNNPQQKGSEHTTRLPSLADKKEVRMYEKGNKENVRLLKNIHSSIRELNYNERHRIAIERRNKDFKSW